ncbi:hypothetical protein SAMN04487850_0367 [Prevotella aff. ruminicola Tc2-24]|uniref:Uncharacterized protein n=1 Tax=Prevotella aff. ruminicola Tc2-24 TaxID=81582 RepID=A0A1I0M5V7_9BACT|nr:hypothetical protein [Prevotella aff. ruminicola Tc2-24]SEV83857.1 hypothetical protein SAMN04487850_0367 [Prevotella aff. ruminicola Tc2-24]
MKNKTTHHTPCAICKSQPADKTNSHIIPSFFVAMVSSIDNSYKRDKELLYTIGDRITTPYIGHAVREEELLSSFDSITDERLAMMNDNTVSKDYIFCPHCEKKLGEYLESPWHDHLFNNRKISPASAYFFWASILWRISVFEGINFKLPTHIEKSLRKRLNAFIVAKDNKSDTSQLMSNLPFCYKVLYCKDYSKHHGGLIYYEYDCKSKVVTLLLGDVAACFSFHKNGSFDKYSFHGLEETFPNASINDGSCNEAILNVDASILDITNSRLINKLQTIRLEADKKNILAMWKMVRKKSIPNLPSKPDDCFIRYVISELHNDTVKSGEKITHEYFSKCFGMGLIKIYNINLY